MGCATSTSACRCRSAQAASRKSSRSRSPTAKRRPSGSRPRTCASWSRPPTGSSPRPERDMNIHEHQAKEVLRRYGVSVPRGRACFTVDEELAAAREIGFPCVVKAQIHAGGRGKAGGVTLAQDEAGVKAAAERLLGATLVTHQTGPQGRVVRRLLVEEGCKIARELYLGMVVDRASGRVTMMASTEGGVEIGEVAGRTPDGFQRQRS